MIEIYCAFSGQNWTLYSCHSINEAEEYLETLRPAEKRPSHIIFSNSSIIEYNYCLSILWTPQIFIEIADNILEGGFESTRKYFQKFLSKIKKSAKHIENIKPQKQLLQPMKIQK